jgi:hypothetical protein
VIVISIFGDRFTAFLVFIFTEFTLQT